MRQRKGVAILMALGALTFMSFIGVSFTINSIFGLKSAFNYYYAKKAAMMADAGIAKAIAELRTGDGGATTDAVDMSEVSYDGTFILDRGLTGSYSVTAVDCASRINLNDGNPNLAQILKNLSGTSSPALLTDADCDNIASHAPYSAEEEIKLYISGSTRAEINEKYAAVADYLTIYGFIDTSIVNPTDIATPYGTQPRSPINVNTASKEVLRAVLKGIKAIHVCPKCGGDGSLAGTSSIGPVTCDACSGTGALEITADEANLLAQYIIDHRPYSGWSQFYESIKGCSSIGSRDADLVMANANPNMGFSWARNYGWASKMGYIGKYLIDWNKNGTVDSGDKGLSVNTTEFSFNSGGYYEITSTGTVSRSLITVSRKNMTCVAKIFDQYRITSQQQFEATGSSKTDVTTYPEPVEVEDPDLRPSAAAYDGQIMLAKKTVGGPDGTSCTSWFNANYRKSLDAQSAGSNKSPSDVKASGSGTKPNIGSVVDYANRGDLMPDGMLSDIFDMVNAAYKCPGNISSGKGTLEIWFKTQWNSIDSMMYGDSDVDRKMFRLTSGSPIDGFTDPDGMPFITLFMWSDGGGTYAESRWGGGQWVPSTSKWGFTEEIFKWGDHWFGWPYGGISWAHWNAGEWNHLAVTWINPSPVTGNPEGTYNTTVCPMYIYFNGEKKLLHLEGAGLCMDNTYFYHDDYADNNDIDYDFMCGNEYSKWNTNEGRHEFSNSVIGSVWIWDTQRSDYEIVADMNNGIYTANGTYEFPEIDFGREVLIGTITWTQAVPDEIADEGGGIKVSVDPTGTKTSWTGEWDDPSSGRAVNSVSDKLAVKAEFIASGTETVEEIDNVLVNGGFESGSLSGWTVALANGATASTAKPYEGTYSLRHGRRSGSGSSKLDTEIYQEVPCVTGAKYRFSGWYSWSADCDSWHGDLELKFYDSAGNIVYSSSKPVSSGHNVGSGYIFMDMGWVAAPASATTVRAGIGVWGNWIPTDNYWDSFVLQQSAISTTGTPALETPVLEDITITYLPRTEILYCKEF